MNEEDAAAILQSHINALVTAKLIPVTQWLGGLEFAVAHIFNLLDQRGVLTRADAIASLLSTREALPPEMPAEAARVFDHLARGLRSLRDPPAEASGPSREDLRSRFQLIQEGLSDEPHIDTDRTE